MPVLYVLHGCLLIHKKQFDHELSWFFCIRNK